MITDEKHLTSGKKYPKESSAEKIIFNKSQNAEKNQITRKK